MAMPSVCDWAEVLRVFEVPCEGIKTSTVLRYWQSNKPVGVQNAKIKINKNKKGNNLHHNNRKKNTKKKQTNKNKWKIFLGSALFPFYGLNLTPEKCVVDEVFSPHTIYSSLSLQTCAMLQVTLRLDHGFSCAVRNAFGRFTNHSQEASMGIPPLFKSYVWAFMNTYKSRHSYETTNQ